MFHQASKFSFFLRTISQVSFGLLLVAASQSAQAERLKVVEMYTSQACYSCPAADELLAELAAQDEDILNLEFHVDYWNKLIYGSAGSWVDPYSNADYSARQRVYASHRLKGSNGVYTPQAIINGQYGSVGSNRRDTTRGLKLRSNQPVDVDISRDVPGTLRVVLEAGVGVDANVYFVEFLRETSTIIPSGENHGKEMLNYNVVTSMESLGSVEDAVNKPLQVAFAEGTNVGCAILVQHPNLGPILGAARCP